MNVAQYCTIFCREPQQARPARLWYSIIEERGYFVYRLIGREWLDVAQVKEAV